MRSGVLLRGSNLLVLVALAAGGCTGSGPGGDAASTASSFELTAGVVETAPLRKIPTPAPNTGFASALDLAGDVLVGGAPRDDAAGYNAGAVHVRGRNVGGTGSWGLVAKLVASDAAPERAFGSAVALSGTLLVRSSSSSLHRLGSGPEASARRRSRLDDDVVLGAVFSPNTATRLHSPISARRWTYASWTPGAACS